MLGENSGKANKGMGILVAFLAKSVSHNECVWIDHFPTLGGFGGREMTVGSSPDDVSHLLVQLTRAAQTFGGGGDGKGWILNPARDRFEDRFMIQKRLGDRPVYYF